MRKSCFKKIISFFICFNFIFLLMPFKITAKEKAEGETYIKIRYERDDKNYNGWNFWTWERIKRELILTLK